MALCLTGKELSQSYEDYKRTYHNGAAEYLVLLSYFWRPQVRFLFNLTKGFIWPFSLRNTGLGWYCQIGHGRSEYIIPIRRYTYTAQVYYIACS